jgi:hypothetical protein
MICVEAAVHHAVVACDAKALDRQMLTLPVHGPVTGRAPTLGPREPASAAKAETGAAASIPTTARAMTVSRTDANTICSSVVRCGPSVHGSDLHAGTEFIPSTYRRGNAGRLSRMNAAAFGDRAHRQDGDAPGEPPSD